MMTSPATTFEPGGRPTVAPAHDAVPAVRPRPHLYLVGEAERSHRAPTAPAGRISIQVNGRWHALRGRTITFAQLLRMAFPDRPLAFAQAATVSFRGGVATRPSGLMTPGDVIEVADGLVVNADATYAS
ncbi:MULTISPECIES: multiubiquitin domain-containing protein [Sphingomonas]|uniref:multiubiquitin domain-containing protein n=1 Tax=Sphingomonas TaxID=13687 RepID=UPI00082E4014|nr:MULTISPECIES: multiubiquitin domain-containing protein [Sphingomonas]